MQERMRKMVCVAVPIFVGGIIHHLVKKRNKGKEEESNTQNGLLFASGLITGEALMGILLAIPIVILAQKNISLPLWDISFGSIIGVVLLIGVAYWLYRTALDKSE